MTETLQARNGGVEQSWRFDKKPTGDGAALEVRVAARGLGYREVGDPGLRFDDDATKMGVRYGHATWVDANGARTRLDARFEGGAIVLRSGQYKSGTPIVAPHSTITTDDVGTIVDLGYPAVATITGGYLVVAPSKSLAGLPLPNAVVAKIPFNGGATTFSAPLPIASGITWSTTTFAAKPIGSNVLVIGLTGTNPATLKGAWYDLTGLPVSAVFTIAGPIQNIPPSSLAGDGSGKAWVAYPTYDGVNPPVVGFARLTPTGIMPELSLLSVPTDIPTFNSASKTDSVSGPVGQAMVVSTGNNAVQASLIQYGALGSPCGDVILSGANPNKPDIYVQYDWTEFAGSGIACTTDAQCKGQGGLTQRCLPFQASKQCECSGVTCNVDADCGVIGPAHLDEACVAGFCRGDTHDPNVVAPGALDAVTAQFGAANRGFNLHIIRGNARAHTHITSYRAPVVGCEVCPAYAAHVSEYASNFYDLKRTAPAFDTNYNAVYHYVLFAHNSSCDSDIDCINCPVARNANGTAKTDTPKSGQTGIAEISGNDSMVTLGNLLKSVTCADDKKYTLAGTFVHELGHNLGLRHGGGVEPIRCAADAACAALGPDHTGEVCRVWNTTTNACTVATVAADCNVGQVCIANLCASRGCVHACGTTPDCTTLVQPRVHRHLRRQISQPFGARSRTSNIDSCIVRSTHQGVFRDASS